jgi:3-methyladenine DNA glycosylase AlkD
MNKSEVLVELEKFGSESIKNIYLKHGAKEPFFGVKISDMKSILKKIKNDQKLALELYQTGNSDAMYLAGLAADGAKMSRKELDDWADKAYWYMLSEFTVPWVLSENKHAWEIALEWIESKEERFASAGWSALSNVLSLKEDKELDISKIKSLLARVEKEIHSAQNRVRYTMNGFVISVAAYVSELSETAIDEAKRIGKVDVDLGGTACKVPFAPEYIEKIRVRGAMFKKKKTVKC